tara:strand:- start:226 stop:804 length:579 start_codon:yes stop_codon:yes gene_type:complete
MEANTFGFHSVCISPYLVKYTSKLLKNNLVQISSVVGFPLGASTSEVKLFEIETLLNYGTDEVDMVMNIGMFKDKNWKSVENEFKDAKRIVGDKIIKIIIETSSLTKDEIVTASKMVEASGADFVKTSTGFSGQGATVDNIHLINDSIGSETKIKASGGINSLKQLQKMLDAGANRIGTSSSVFIMEEIPLI